MIKSHKRVFLHVWHAWNENEIPFVQLFSIIFHGKKNATKIRCSKIIRLQFKKKILVINILL